MRCLADFVLDSDLCLVTGAEPLTLNAPDGVLSNAGANPAEPKGVLLAQLIFETDKLDRNTREPAMEKLSEILNCLCYTTGRKFVCSKLKRLIDWTPGILERDAIIYAETPEWDLAEPKLDDNFTKTAERIFDMGGGDEQRAAMRWYRLGIQAEGLEEQFSYFWFALEISAEALKGNDKVPSKCPRCHGKLYCENCQEHPLHRRYPGEAIHQVVERVQPQNVDEIFKTLQSIRHTLMHGGRIASIDSLPCTAEEAVDKLAWITWLAIDLMFKPDPEPEQPFHFGYTDSIVRRRLIAAVQIRTTLLPGSDPQNPKLSDFPTIDLREVK